MRKLLGVILCLPLVFVTGVRIYKSVIFDINCGDRIKRAADSNTVELATKEMEAVNAYIDTNSLYGGYTSVIYNSPDEDVTFWHNNLSASLDELRKVTPNTSQLERSNVLMKLRETLLDHNSDGVSVTVPEGISVYPYNVGYTFCFLFGTVLLVAGVIVFLWGIDAD